MSVRRIAYIGIKGLPSQAGADRVVEAIVKNLDKTQYQPVVYCSSKVVPKETRLPGIQLTRIHALPGKYFGPTSLFFFAALHALIFARYDLVHLHNLEASYILPLLKLRYPVITTSHGPTQNRSDKWGIIAKTIFLITEWMCMVLSNAVTSVSAPHVDYFRNRYGKTVYYIPNGVDIEPDVDDDSARAILRQASTAPNDYILFAGRIMPTKGCHVLLEAFLQLDTELNLLIVGDDTILPQYSLQLKEKADTRVRFVPFISDKPTLLGIVQDCRLFIFPSTVEAMSMMLLEAATVEAPIICSDIPENRAVLPDQALVFRAEDPNDLAEKLSWALAHPKEMNNLSVRASARVGEEFSWQDIVGRYQQLYEGILQLPSAHELPVEISGKANLF